MNIACIRHSLIPGSTPLFLDLLYRHDRVSELYPHPPELSAAHAAAQAIEHSAEHRQALVEALRPRNRAGGPRTQANLNKLAEPGTVVVAAGQQVGLFGGPVFSLYKALTAAKHAATLTEQGLPAVPIFWLATEDHDLAEIDHTRLLGGDNQTHEIRAGSEAVADQPAGLAVVAEPRLDELRLALSGLDYAEETLALVEQAYAGRPTFGDAFAALFARLLEPFGVILLDPLEPAIRRLAAPLIRRAIEQNAEFPPALMERGEALRAAGYHEQVQVSDASSLLFLLEDGRRGVPQRTVLKRTADGFRAAGDSYSTTDLLERLDREPGAFSPNALLRPVLQDYLLPTAAFVAGPSELAYLAQSDVLYERLLGRTPVFLPRASFTLFDARGVKLLKRYGLSPADTFVPAEELRHVLGGRLTPPEVARGVERSRGRVEGALDSLAEVLREFDPTLVAALGRSRKKMLYQVSKLESRIEREALRRDERAAGDAERLAAWAYPHNHLQERYYGILPFLARFGPGLTETLYKAVRHNCVDHQALAV